MQPMMIKTMMIPFRGVVTSFAIRPLPDALRRLPILARVTMQRDTLSLHLVACPARCSLCYCAPVVGVCALLASRHVLHFPLALLRPIRCALSVDMRLLPVCRFRHRLRVSVPLPTIEQLPCQLGIKIDNSLIQRNNITMPRIVMPLHRVTHYGTCTEQKQQGMYSNLLISIRNTKEGAK